MKQDIFEDARTQVWASDQILMPGEWLRLDGTDYEVRIDTASGWIAVWRIDRMSARTGVSDIVRVDLGLHRVFVPVINGNMPRVIHDITWTGDDFAHLPECGLRLRIRFAPLSDVTNNTDARSEAIVR